MCLFTIVTPDLIMRIARVKQLLNEVPEDHAYDHNTLLGFWRSRTTLAR